MSVAFRRESDEEHLEPRLELPIPPGPNFVTARGLERIRTCVDAIEAKLQTELLGDERDAVLRDARYWRQRQASAQLAPMPAGDRVAIGTRVRFLQDGVARTIEVVGHDESDPGDGRVAFSAPLARALLNAEVGDEVDFTGCKQPLIVTRIEVAD